MTDLVHHEGHAGQLTPRGGLGGLGGGSSNASTASTCGPNFLGFGHTILEVGVDFGDFFLGNHGWIIIWMRGRPRFDAVVVVVAVSVSLGGALGVFFSPRPRDLVSVLRTQNHNHYLSREREHEQKR